MTQELILELYFEKMWSYIKYIVKDYSDQMLIVGLCIYKGEISRL